MILNELANEDLRKWFKQKWVNIGKKKDGKHPPCGTSGSKSGYAKCVPAAKAAGMSKKEKESATRRKRAAQNNADRGGKDSRGQGKSPINVSTKKNEAQAVSGGKVHKFITGKNLGFRGKKYNEIDFETINIDNKAGTIRVKILAPKEIFGNEMSLDFRSVRRGPYFKTNTGKLNNESTNPSDIIRDLDKVKNNLIKKVDVLIAKKKKLYSNVDIESPMSADEKKLNKDISDIFGEIQQLILQKRKAKNESVNEDWSQKYKKSIDCNNPKGFSQKAHCAGKLKNENMASKLTLEEKMNLFLEKNVPNDPAKWAASKAAAKRKFDVYPSAYANGWAAKNYKGKGGTWKTAK